MDHPLVHFVPNHFTIEEFIDPETLQNFKSKGLDPWTLMDPRILWCAEGLRTTFNVPFIINNWHTGGERSWSGLRTPKSPYYSSTSQHSFGKAVDIISPKMTAVQMRNFIFNDPWNDAWAYITAIEVTNGGKPIDWLHIDVRNYDKEKNGILKVNA